MSAEPKTFNGAPGEVYGDDFHNEGGTVPTRYRCLQCAWTGSKPINAWDHHQIAHHRIEIAGVGLSQFGCCAGGMQQRTA